jgi:hypothetical protein
MAGHPEAENDLTALVVADAAVEYHLMTLAPEKEKTK